MYGHLWLKIGSATAAVVTLLVIAWALFPGGDRPESSVADAVKTSSVTLRYSFNLENQSNELIQDIAFQTFAPVEKTPFQTVEWVRSSHSHQTEVDEVGNQTLHFTIDQLPPYGQTEVSVSTKVTLRNQPKPGETWARNDFLKSEPLIERDAPVVQSQVARVSRQDGVTTAHSWMEAAHRRIAHSLDDTGYSAEDRGAVFALEQQAGDCTEFMYALVAMARNQEIPAVPLAGFRTNSRSTVVQASDYHNWLLFNAEDSWALSDPHGDVFNTNERDYIAFRVLQPGLRTDARDSAERFFVHDHRITASMN
ncbi:transglutaminase superfamily protein [Halospina denitrificans]|uniref:Transglutaminase superfamily protein n=1 Tax=Halospina denitrificans TaxID=332522 RepID=A0A4R7JN99_9GAMM|nr:transglutaminase family protein [Halospina denitrificans]TDT38603.1 transglutaminase superfamily protein [Halospina denitrificans]